METQQEEKQNNEGKIDEQPLNPSSSSSPSHEFSFSISLHPTSTKIPDSTINNKSPPPSLAIDLSPADEIFFHGHLLPLHLLSHLQSISPRSSINSLDSFTLPIKELSENYHTSNDHDHDHDHDRDHHQESNLLEVKRIRKAKSFSLFGLPKWRKRDDDDDQQGLKRKFKFDVGCVVKKYMSLVKPYLSSLRNKRRDSKFRPNYSFQGPNLKANNYKNHEYFSAPASMSVSPTNSGILVASGNVTPTNKNDSTMEELQAAIQAAIAHCKKSIANDDIIMIP